MRDGRRQLQVALDAPEAIACLESIRDLVDVIEIGTPLLKRFGLSAITTVKQLAPTAVILADSKTADGGYLEARMLYDAGAEMITVLSEAGQATWDAVARAATECRHEAVIDTLLASDVVEAATRQYPAAFTYIALHVSADSRQAGTASAAGLAPLLSALPRHRKVAVAGGVNRDTIAAIVAAGPDLVVVGRAITQPRSTELIPER